MVISSSARVSLLGALLVAAGCGGARSQARPDATGSGGAGSGGVADGGAAGADAAGGADAAIADPCPKAPAPLRATGTTVTLTVTPTLGGKPFAFGEPNDVPAGGELTPLNFRFYVSHVALRTTNGPSVPVDLVTAAGAIEPYGVHLFNAEDAGSATLRLLAPVGSYAGVELLLGLDAGCNMGAPSARAAPLDDASQMSWPHTAGYLFLRFEGRMGGAADGGGAATADSGADGGDAGGDAGPLPLTIHMGGLPGGAAPVVKAEGALSVAAGAPLARTLRLDMDEVFAGAEALADTSGVPPFLASPEVFAGERLRQHAATLPLFVLAP